jgi:hypothetical protein
MLSRKSSQRQAVVLFILPLVSKVIKLLIAVVDEI